MLKLKLTGSKMDSLRNGWDKNGQDKKWVGYKMEGIEN